MNRHNTTICTCGDGVEEHVTSAFAMRVAVDGPHVPLCRYCECDRFHADPQLCALKKCANKASPIASRDGPRWLCHDCYVGLMSGDYKGAVPADYQHRSDCAVHNMPAMPNEPCNCME